MELKGTVKYRPEWDFDTFLNENYKLYHSDFQKRRIYTQFLYCSDVLEKIKKKV